MVEGTRRHVRHLVRHPPFVSGPPLRRHVLDPRRRKTSIIRRPLVAGSSCSHWSIFSMTTSRPPWRSTVSCPLIPRALPGAGCDLQAPDIAEHPGTRPGPVSLSETAGLAACGETGMTGPASEALDRGTLGPGRDLSMGTENCRVLGTESGRVGPLVEAWATVFRPAVFPWPAHTVHGYPMSSISI